MKQTNEFDDLARRKLEERAFPMEAAHWEDMQRLLALEQRKRRGFYWPLAAGLLLLVGTGLWWQLAQEPAPDVISEVNDVKAADPAELVTAPAATTTPAPLPVIKAEPSVSRHSAPAATTPAAPDTRPVAPITEPSPRNATRDGQRSTPRRSNEPVVAPTLAVAASGEPGRPAPAEAIAPPVVPSEGPTVPPVVVVAPSMEPSPPIVLAEPTAQGAPTAGTADSTKTAPPLPIAANLKDTSSTTPPEPLVAPVKPGSWDITLLGGTLLSTSTYSGGTSAAWSEALTGQHAPAFGLEAMRMGRHFGFGTGLHYTTYAERYMQEAQFATATNYNDVFFLTPVDTTVLIVTDTVFQGGQVLYVTAPFTITINVLDQTIDTVTTTVQTQQARDQVNSLSYLEVPLLGDVHSAKGKWQFGVRGGPTIGLLTGRRGAVPDSQMDGLTDYADQPFRSYGFGYVARAYVRFSFCTAWSVGIEPMLRGHFTDAYEDYTLSRRSAGLGAMLSLSYRLP
jgi:hypothetical protein